MSTHAQGLGLRRVRSHLANNGTLDVAFSLTQQDRHTEVVPLFMRNGGSSMAGLRYPSHGRSRQTGYPIRPSAEGRSSWLNFPRKILVFSIPNWFYPGTHRPLCFAHHRNPVHFEALGQRCGRGPRAGAKPATLGQVSAKFSRRIQPRATPWNPLTLNNR